MDDNTYRRKIREKKVIVAYESSLIQKYCKRKEEKVEKER